MKYEPEIPRRDDRAEFILEGVALVFVIASVVCCWLVMVGMVG